MQLTRLPKPGVRLPAVGPRNPFLAESAYPIAHGRCDQQDNTPVCGPTGPGGDVADDLSYTWVGPGHFGGLISAPYPDGRRVIWSNGRESIVKLDYDTLEPLAVYTIPGHSLTPVSELEAAVAGLDALDGDAAVMHAAELARRFLTGLDGVYSLL